MDADWATDLQAATLTLKLAFPSVPRELRSE